jgi:hypothetical protein
MFSVPKSGPVEVIAEFGNSWGSAMRIWNALIYKYLVPSDLVGMERDGFIGRMMMSGFQELWPLSESSKLSRSERLTLASTYDKVICEIDRCNELADAYEDFKRLYPSEGVDHLPAMVKLLRGFQGRAEMAGVCWQQTSVSDDQWNVRPDNDEDESRPFDLSVDDDNDHWFLFDQIDSTELEG